MKSILSPKIAELTGQLSNGDTQAFHTFLDKIKQPSRTYHHIRWKLIYAKSFSTSNT
ncbi:hypothetical protein U2I54_22660 [Bacillus pseudomycoides]|uniref:Uncharacterized protein n=1 Tax=Bacillus bingmayongensis TaxID=1150157 RepID=A0ABU5K206_9BACI|nr:hypothetical protein [Bacillus pseudomycoides]